MNKRVKQLLGQAYDEAVPETWTTLSSEQLGRVYEKFAELIVGECIEQGDILAKHYIDTHSEFEQTLLLASIADYSNEMKKHFGVEL